MKNIFKILITCLLYSNTYFGQGWSWSKHIGSSANDMALHASDSSDNLYVITNFFGSYCYSPGDTSAFCKGKNDLFLNKYNSAGVLIWSKQFGENNLNNCLEGIGAINVDKFGNIILVGSFCDMINFGCNTLSASGKNLFLVKLDVNGNCLWAKKSIGAGLYGASGLDIDDFGNIYICGTTSNSTIFDTDTISAGGFILKYNSSGNLIWAKNKFRSFNNYPYFTEFLSFDLKLYNNHIFISGNVFNDTIIIDTSFSLLPQINISSSLCSFDMNANIEWVKFFGGNNSGLGPRFCINENTGIYLSGGFAGQGVFDQFLLTGNSTSDLYIAKFNFNGSINWVQQANSSTISFGWSTASNKKDASVYVTGYFGGTAYFGGFNVVANSSRDMFITHYDSVGVCFGVRNFSNAEGHIVTMDTNDFPIISGVFNDTINIGLNSISSYGMQDVFIAKCDAITGNMENKPPNNQLLIYANPTQGKCNITIPDEFANEKQLTLTVYDNIGRVIQVQTITMHEGKIKLNLTAEAKGMYHVSLSNGKKSFNGKIVFE